MKVFKVFLMAIQTKENTHESLSYANGSSLIFVTKKYRNTNKLSIIM